MKSERKRAIELFNQYQFDEAQSILEDLVVAKPNDIEAWFYLGKIGHRTQDYGKALNCFQKVLEFDNKHDGARTAIKLIQDILKLTNNFYFENAYTDDGLYLNE
jgi:tetratricopeptide (TPR) repeat protein